MIIAIASGKGGTGKTTIATSLALSLAPPKRVKFLDCDVEAPNAHLFLKPKIDRQVPASLPVPTIDEAICQLCGRCAEVCQYHAITVAGEKVMVFPELCHGCGSCTLNCPEGAIHEVLRPLGMLESGLTKESIRFEHGILNIGQPLAVPVIRRLKGWTRPYPDELTIIDAPPGTSCPVVETIRGVDFVLLVTEPTPFGLHDLRLAYQLTRDLNLPAGVIINRDGIGDERASDFCDEHDLPVLMRIPLDQNLAAALAQGRPLVDCAPQYRPQFQRLFEEITAGREEPV
jgi:MinD superfamily P-loop ATPase